MVIGSNSNERVKELKKLVKSSKERNEKGLYIVEGIRMFREIPEELICETYVSEDALEKYKTDVSEKVGEHYVVLTKGVFDAVADTKTPQGILSVVRMKEYDLEELLHTTAKEGKTPFMLIVEKLQDPGNLGTIIRASEAAGVTGVILSSECVDMHNPKVVRSTMGSIFRVPVCISSDLIKTINLLKENNITIYGAHLKGDSLYKSDFKKPSAFLIGNEGNGLSREVAEASDKLIYIPMLGQVESLNAAISASIISYEVLRQKI